MQQTTNCVTDHTHAKIPIPEWEMIKQVQCRKKSITPVTFLLAVLVPTDFFRKVAQGLAHHHRHRHRRRRQVRRNKIVRLRPNNNRIATWLVEGWVGWVWGGREQEMAIRTRTGSGCRKNGEKEK